MKINMLYHRSAIIFTALKGLIPIFILAIVGLSACDPAKRSVNHAPTRPTKPSVPGREPIDTIRWTPNNGKPPIKNDPSRPDRPAGSGDTYHIAFLLPFLTNQASAGVVPEKSTLALQFYAGAKLALAQVSEEENLNLVVDAWDTQANDSDFQTLLNTTTRIQKPSVFIGPIRGSHVSTFAAWAKTRRKIVVSPESPNADLTAKNPDFIQTNPSLRAHCSAITRYVRKTHRPDAVTLVCKKKEADRLPYFQDANSSMGGTGAFAELVLPDDALNFDKADLKKYFKAGRTAVFIMPSWASQDFVMAFLRKLKEVKGANRVEVYGMPQWQSFDAIDAEYLIAMNVHISDASYIDYTAADVKAFQQKFYEATGTIPNEDAFNGYDVTLFTARMLARHGLSFPEYLDKEAFRGLHGIFAFSKIYSDGGLDAGNNTPDYLENTQVHILKFGKAGFAPIGK
jgi:hypothetical protein